MNIFMSGAHGNAIVALPIFSVLISSIHFFHPFGAERPKIEAIESVLELFTEGLSLKGGFRVLPQLCTPHSDRSFMPP